MAKSCGAGILPTIIAYNYTKYCDLGILPAIIAYNYTKSCGTGILPAIIRQIQSSTVQVKYPSPSWRGVGVRFIAVSQIKPISECCDSLVQV